MINETARIAVTSRTFCRSEKMCTELEKYFSNVKYNSEGLHFNENTLMEFLSNCEGAILSEEKLSKKVINNLPELKVVSKFGVGLDSIDVPHMQEKGISLKWKPGVNAASVAELSICYLILILREAQILNKSLTQGSWLQSTNSRNLSEVTIGILGFGQIGQKLAEYLKPFNSKILAHDEFIDSKIGLPDIEFVSFEELLEKSDAVSIHLPLNKSTKGIISHKELAMMKQDSVLINLSRGGIVDEDALYEALLSQKLAGAAFDVFEEEPIESSDLFSLKNFYCTPHIAGTSISSTNALGLSAIEGLKEFFKE